METYSNLVAIIARDDCIVNTLREGTRRRSSRRRHRRGRRGGRNRRGRRWRWSVFRAHTKHIADLEVAWAWLAILSHMCHIGVKIRSDLLAVITRDDRIVDALDNRSGGWNSRRWNRRRSWESFRAYTKHITNLKVIRAWGPVLRHVCDICCELSGDLIAGITWWLGSKSRK
jgi:hypothetical protein